MQKDDMSLIRLADLPTAIALLTRLPVKAGFERPALSVWAYPFAGLVLGLCAAVVASLAFWIGLSTPLVAGLWIATTVILSGAMHEDGLADCADGFWGGWEKDRRLEIMKDSQIGTYGVLALLFSVVLRWLAITAILQQGPWIGALITGEILSRAFLPALMHILPHARETGLSHAQGRPPLNAALCAVALATILGLILTGWQVIPLLIIGGLAAAVVGLIAQRKIAGQTGDVLGASQQIALLAILIALA
jgi:adenosylcobinamide-GDP ribazoletransferase